MTTRSLHDIIERGPILYSDATSGFLIALQNETLHGYKETPVGYQWLAPKYLTFNLNEANGSDFVDYATQEAEDFHADLVSRAAEPDEDLDLEAA